MNGATTALMQTYLDRIRDGDPEARSALLAVSEQRLRLLTGKMFRKYPGLWRWVEYDDVFHNVVLRLDHMLHEFPVLSPRDYLRLATTHIRRELIDLTRRLYGPEGIAANHATPFAGDGANPEAEAGSSYEPSNLAAWGEFHEQIDLLPDELREVWDLLWYHGLSQEEAADLLKVCLRTIGRRWQKARLRLAEMLGEHVPS